jgi:hypothetical protein
MRAKAVNWDFIQPLYRAGGLSNYEIARQYELTHANHEHWKPTVTEAAIRDYAKRHHWAKDLTEQVKQRTQDKLLRAELRVAKGETNRESDEDIVEQAAENRAQVVAIQRRDLQELEAIEADIIRRINEDETQVLVGWYEGVANEHRVKLGLLERCRAYRELVTARTRRIATARIAWGLDEKKQQTETPGVDVSINLGGREENAQ